jgi:CubicO group peptidase (beta-lactamase class C family)
MPQFDDAAIDRVRSAAHEVIEKHHLPGISVGVASRDGLVYAEGFGLADIESGTPMRPERRQRIASITKTMVGLCAMALVDEGKLSLDDRVVDRLPEVAFDGPAETMTIRHLLTHTSGIGEAATVEGLASIANPDRAGVEMPGDFATLYPKGIVVEAVPGTKWHYCNNGYGLLGEIIIRTEGASLHDVLQRRVFGPLAMAGSDCLDQPHPALTTGYHRPPSEDTREQLERAGIAIPDEPLVDGHNIRGKFTAEFNKGMLAAGAVQSTVPDMARYAAALLRRGAGIVRPETFDAMIAPQYSPDQRLLNWGLSFIRTPRFGRTLIGHGGAFFGGWNSNLALVPDEDIAVIQHMNIMLDAPGPVFNRILSAVFDTPQPSYPDRAVDAAILDTAPGTYELTPGRLTNFRPATRIGRLHIERAGDALTLRSRWGPWKDGVRLTPCDPVDPAFFVIQRPDADPAYVALTPDAAGHVDGLRCDELVHMVRRDTPR